MAAWPIFCIFHIFDATYSMKFRNDFEAMKLWNAWSGGNREEDFFYVLVSRRRFWTADNDFSASTAGGVIHVTAVWERASGLRVSNAHSMLSALFCWLLHMLNKRTWLGKS